MQGFHLKHVFPSNLSPRRVNLKGYDYYGDSSALGHHTKNQRSHLGFHATLISENCPSPYQNSLPNNKFYTYTFYFISSLFLLILLI